MINSVAKALDILALFHTGEPTLTLTEISRRLGMPKSTAHHLLMTMAHYGFIEQIDGGSYALGKRIIALTQNVLVNVELRDRAAPLLRALADSCNESVYLTVRDDQRVLYIYAIESPQRLLARTAVGDHAPMYCTSVGKAVLAYLPSDEIERMYADQTLHAYTPYTLTDLDALRQDLALTHTRGYAIDNQEHELHTYCIGAPVFDAYGRVVGACSISGIDQAIVGARLDALASGVVGTAQEISRRMGYVPARMSMVRPYNNKG